MKENIRQNESAFTSKVSSCADLLIACNFIFHYSTLLLDSSVLIFVLCNLCSIFLGKNRHRVECRRGQNFTILLRKPKNGSYLMMAHLGSKVSRA